MEPRSADKIQRYSGNTCCGSDEGCYCDPINEDDTGDYVSYDDYCKLEQALQSSQKENEKLRNSVPGSVKSYIAQLEHQQKEIQALEADLKSVTAERDTEIKRAREAERDLKSSRAEIKNYKEAFERVDLADKNIFKEQHFKIEALEKKLEGAVEALRNIIQDDVHTLDHFGSCLKCSEEDHLSQCIINKATEAIHLITGGKTDGKG